MVTLGDYYITLFLRGVDPLKNPNNAYLSKVDNLQLLCNLNILRENFVFGDFDNGSENFILEIFRPYIGSLIHFAKLFANLRKFYFSNIAQPRKNIVPRNI